MNLDNILCHPSRYFLLIIGLLTGSLPVQASVIYEFQSAPIAVGVVDIPSIGNEVRTESVLPGGSVRIGDPITASLSFASPLLPGTTDLSAESGGFDFIPGPNQGNVEAYSTRVGMDLITSDINAYATGGLPDTYEFYSSLNGQITTDASGAISAWDLNFVLYSPGTVGSSFVIDQSASPPTINRSPILVADIDAGLSISSNRSSPVTINDVFLLDRLPHSGPYPTFNAVDFVSENSIEYFTKQPGTFTNPGIGTVSEPGTLGLMIAGLGLLGWQRRGLKK